MRTNPQGETVALSAACGAWQVSDHAAAERRHAHEYCSGRVTLPAPHDACKCWCHGHEDGIAFDGTAAEWVLYNAARLRWEREATGQPFAEWLASDREYEAGLVDDDDYMPACPACGSPIDFCQGHGEMGDPGGRAILDAHDAGDHSSCHPDGCDERG
jgi:hypothetical protein